MVQVNRDITPIGCSDLCPWLPCLNVWCTSELTKRVRSHVKSVTGSHWYKYRFYVHYWCVALIYLPIVICTEPIRYQNSQCRLDFDVCDQCNHLPGIWMMRHIDCYHILNMWCRSKYCNVAYKLLIISHVSPIGNLRSNVNILAAPNW